MYPVGAFLVVFALFFMMGGIQALNQNVYYFVGTDKIAVSIYESYVVATNVWIDGDTNKIKCGGKYYLLPMEGLEMTVIETGRIESVVVGIN